jgi:hypothetical protein
LAISLIDNEECKIIQELNEERNKFLHRRETKRYARGREATEKYVPFVNEAIRILKEKFNVVRLRARNFTNFFGISFADDVSNNGQ